MPIGFTWNVFIGKKILSQKRIKEVFYERVVVWLRLSGDNVVSMLMEANSFHYGGELELRVFYGFA